MVEENKKGKRKGEGKEGWAWWAVKVEGRKRKKKKRKEEEGGREKWILGFRVWWGDEKGREIGGLWAWSGLPGFVSSRVL